MEDDGWCEAAGEAKVAPPTFDLYSDLYSDVYSKISESKIRWCEYDYDESEGLQWSDTAHVYSSYYSDNLTETGKDDLFKVPVRYLESFCGRHHAPWLREMLTDAVMFFKLHNTWQVYICPSPDCLCWFLDDDSLVLHLMHEHCNTWPILRHDLTEEQWSSKALRSTVWKPIDVKAALNALAAIFVDGKGADGRLDGDRLGSLEWPLSEDSTRSELLAALQRGFEMLLDSREKDSFIVRSNGCLRAVIAVASEDILRHLDPTNILPLPFRTLLYSSPLPFRFMDEASLCRFVKLVEGLCNLVKNQASQSRESEASQYGDVNWSKGEYLDAISISAGCAYFVLDATKLNLCGVDKKDVGSWLFKAPMFPFISKVPDKAIEILLLVKSKASSFSECLATVRKQPDLKLAGLASCLKLWNMGHWPMSLLETWSSELALKSASNPANVNDTPSLSSYSVREAAKRQKIEINSQHYLELIKLTCELQFSEIQVRQLCAVDIRMYLLPLLRSCLRMKLYMFMRIGCSGTGDVEEEDADEGHIMDGSREELLEEHAHCKLQGQPAAEDGSDVTMPDLSSDKRSEELSLIGVGPSPTPN